MSARNIDDQEIDNSSFDDDENIAYDELSDDETTSEEWSDDADLNDDTSDEGADNTPPKKKKSNTMTIVITLVVAVIGVFGFMILSGNKNGQNQPPVVQNTPINADPDNAPVANVVTTPNQDVKTTPSTEFQAGAKPVNTNTEEKQQPEQGLMENPAVIDNGTGQTDQSPVSNNQPANMQSEQVTEGSVSPTATPQNNGDVSSANVHQANTVVENITPEVKPVSDFPTVDAIKKPEVSNSNTQVETEPLQPSLATNGNVASVDETKLNELQSSLTSAEEKIAELEKKIADRDSELSKAKQAIEDQSATEIETLKVKISDLEDKLAQKAVEKSSKPETMKRSVKVDASQEIENVKEMSTAIPVYKKQTSVPTVSSPKSAKPVNRNSWVLKSATGSKAVLSDKLTGDLKTVHVGDIVSGLGRITSISNPNNSWVVVGTMGTITE